MREDIMRTATPKDNLINEIIQMEWSMFDKVNNIGGRAGCQDDSWTFYVMRFSQFAVYNVEILNLYKADLHEALAQGRNMITEKYAYMMEFTDPDNYNAQLKPYMPIATPTKLDLVAKVGEMLIRWEAEFAADYPGISGNSRPLAGNSPVDVSFMIYTLGELRTYSERTLSAILAGLQDMQAKGINPSHIIHRNTVEFYGYKDLDDAEHKILSGRI